MEQTLEQQARARDNDYTALEATYHRATGGELVSDPYSSARYQTPGNPPTASVVIPAWNARETIAACLCAIAGSSFNQRYPERLEVVVVDDGSTDGTRELLERLNVGVRLKVLQQAHHSRAHTQNTGIAAAEGDIIISCDADMILAPCAIAELVQRHQVLRQIMLIGFRGDVDPADPRIQPEALPTALLGMFPPFMQDVRLSYRAGGWPESMCRDTDHLKRLGGGKQIVMADGARWDLPGMVYGALFSLRRDDFLAMEGYDERFYGWGCEDTLVGVRARALDTYIIPVYAAAGLHIAHGDRSPRKWHEFAANRQVFQTILRAPFAPSTDARWRDRAAARICRQFERPPGEYGVQNTECGMRHQGSGIRDQGSGVNTQPLCTCFYAALEAQWADPERRGKLLHALGRYGEAADSFTQVRGTPKQEAWAAFDRGKALRAAGQPEQAAPLLEDAAGRLPASPWPAVELALALAAQGRFVDARAWVDRAAAVEPANPTVAFLLHRPTAKHLERAAFYACQGDPALARCDYEAALILEPHNAAAQVGRATALAALGCARDAQTALSAYMGSLPANDPRGGPARLELARLQLALGEAGAAKVTLERARRLGPRGVAWAAEVAARLAEVHALAVQAQPLPLPRAIVERSQAIPGWFGADEAELLVALAFQALARCDSASGTPSGPRLVEIGRYCGRATVALALAARALGRTEARIVAVDEPGQGLAPGGRDPGEVLREHLAAQALADLVVWAPEEEPEPWKRASQMLLVDGRHDYASVRADIERYVPALAPGGLLLFHDYADYFPDVQRCVDELLLDSGFQFVAQAGSLIALRRGGGDTLPLGRRSSGSPGEAPR